MDERIYCCCELVRTELQGTIMSKYMLLHTAETCTDKILSCAETSSHLDGQELLQPLWKPSSQDLYPEALPYTTASVV
jgi:hypothetical protein